MKLLKRTGKNSIDYFKDLIKFIDKKLITVIDEDLNFLLQPESFRKIRSRLKSETLMLLKQEIAKFEFKPLVPTLLA